MIANVVVDWGNLMVLRINWYIRGLWLCHERSRNKVQNEKENPLQQIKSSKCHRNEISTMSWPEASCVTFLCYVHELIAKRVIVTIGYSS